MQFLLDNRFILSIFRASATLILFEFLKHGVANVFCYIAGVKQQAIKRVAQSYVSNVEIGNTSKEIEMSRFEKALYSLHPFLLASIARRYWMGIHRLLPMPRRA